MRVIRLLEESDLDEFNRIMIDAYPGFGVATLQEQRRFYQQTLVMRAEPNVHFYGLFEDGQLLGGMRLHDFTMNMRGILMPVGGLGGVAVDLRRKKEKAARDMVHFFLEHYTGKTGLTALYPFRPDFYRKMGFGYGTKISQYAIKPDSLPRGSSKAHVVFLGKPDKEAVADCYRRVFTRTHGFMAKMAYELNALFGNEAYRAVGYRRQERLEGYLVFSFKRGNAVNFMDNDLVVREFVYETRRALRELLTFLHTQADQVGRIIFNTHDDSFHYLLWDPRNTSGNLIPPVYHESNTQGVGLMYRVIDVPRLFSHLHEHNFGGQSCRLKITIADSFFPANEGSVVVDFNGGWPRVVAGGEHEVEITLDVAEFSSLLVGAVPFERLYAYHLAGISDERYIDTISRLFAVPRKPVCLSRF